MENQSTTPNLTQNEPAVPEFKPTKQMLDWLKSAVDPEVNPTISAISADCGVNRKNWYLWQKRLGFKEWYQREWKRNMAEMEPFFDKVGMMRATKDYRYWEAMQMKYFKFARKESIDNNIIDAEDEFDYDQLSVEELEKLDELNDKARVKKNSQQAEAGEGSGD